MFTLDKVQKYNANKNNLAEIQNMIKRLYAIYKKVIKSSARIQAYQAYIYNKSYCNFKYKIGQKVWLKVKNITIE